MTTFINNWIGYHDGAIKADAKELVRVEYSNDGNLYAFMTTGEIYNVHQLARACGADDSRIEYAAGVYPIRWQLDQSEINALPNEVTQCD